jgi:NAD(P)-dependent dehydrogenase (short-subunit alcohol dehydrogenase family)
MNDKMCDGRVVIVTGGGRGLGREYALMLAAEGAKVVVNDLGGAADGSGADRTPAQEVVAEIRAMGGEAVVNSDDVSDYSAAKRLIEQAVETFGGLDVLVNNAGILRDRMLTNMTEAEWDDVIRVHLKGTFAPSHHAAVYWRDRSKAGKGNQARLINTTSASGIYGNPGQTNYGAAKQGIAGFTYIASLELERYGVTVNAIAPGALTRLTGALRSVEPTEEQKEALGPKWVASLCTWLASTQSEGVTGRVFEASGRVLAVAEGWHRGPTAAPSRDPHQMDEIMRGLLNKTRPAANIDGADRTS